MKKLLLFLCLLISLHSFSQGRVVINEFMAWPSCAATTEFIELMNFGPGPMNIGCYVVTNGIFSVTIPPNTILEAGDYFVIAGQDVLPAGCGNADKAVTVNLNWNSCNCTNLPIPQTGDGFMKDGGSANEKLVLLDPSLNMIDAISRQLPVTASDLITTSTVGGACTSQSFDLDNMGVNYETIGISTGRNNSFSRNVDGDCGWVKTPQISAGAPNNTGSTSSATYTFSTLSASECNSKYGRIAITVSATDVASLFPMNYLLAYDQDSNGIFNELDSYRYGIDNDAPDITIDSIPYGRYRITVGSSQGCNLKSFDFFIFNCYGVVLNTKLLSFSVKNDQEKINTSWSIDHAEYLNQVIVEASTDGRQFQALQTFTPPTGLRGKWEPDFDIVNANPSLRHIRLRIQQLTGETYFSSTIVLPPLASAASARVWPNPSTNLLTTSYTAMAPGKVEYFIYSINHTLVNKGEIQVQAGNNVLKIPITSLKAGNYQLYIRPHNGQQGVRLPFIKIN